MLVGTLTHVYLRDTYLRGVDLGVAWVGPSADVAIESLLQGLIEEAQTHLGIRFRRQTVLTYPDAGLVLGQDYDIEGEPLTYFRPAPGASSYTLPLPFANVQSIERVRLFAGNPGTPPQGQPYRTMPPGSILLTGKEGILRILPGLLGATELGMATAAVLDPRFLTGREIPGAWAVDYTIGNGEIALDVARWICLKAAIQVLSLAGAGADLTHGLSAESLSMDGITESVSYAQGEYGPYSGVIKGYQCALDGLDIRQLRLKSKGIKVAIW